MNTTRANIINALHALESGKSAAEVTAWLKDAIDCLTLPQVFGRGLRRLERNPVVSVRYPDGDEFARCVQFTNYIVVHLPDRPPVHVRTLDDAIDYIKLVINLK